MSNLPEGEPQRIPEGQYQFKVIEEPELRKKTSASTGDDFTTVKFSFELTDGEGNIRYHKESFVPWDYRYTDLLLAFGATRKKDGKVHLSEQKSVVGKTFEAEIIHEPDKNDSSKMWARVAKIKVETEEEDEDIPF